MLRMCASNSHSYTHLILALGIVRKPTVWVFITSEYPGTHDIGRATKKCLTYLCLADGEGGFVAGRVKDGLTEANCSAECDKWGAACIGFSINSPEPTLACHAVKSIVDKFEFVAQRCYLHGVGLSGGLPLLDLTPAELERAQSRQWLPKIDSWVGFPRPDTNIGGSMLGCYSGKVENSIFTRCFRRVDPENGTVGFCKGSPQGTSLPPSRVTTAPFATKMQYHT